MNAIDFLTNEHNKVRRAFADIASNLHTNQEKKQLFNNLCQDLIIHETMEQTVWYPHLKNDQRLSEEIRHLLSEEKAAEQAIKKFNDSLTDNDWDQQFAQLKNDVEHHANEEEEKLFPEVKKTFTEDELNTLGTRMYDFKKEHTISHDNNSKNKTNKFTTELFDNTESAEKAYHEALTNGYSKKDINVLMSDDTRKKRFTSAATEEMADKSMEGLALGGALGGVVAGTLGAVAAIGTNIIFPGVGLVISGPLAVGLATAGAGSITGGLIGTLIGWGIPEEQAKKYEKGIKSGGIVLGIHEKPEHPVNLRHNQNH